MRCDCHCSAYQIQHRDILVAQGIAADCSSSEPVTSQMPRPRPENKRTIGSAKTSNLTHHPEAEFLGNYFEGCRWFARSNSQRSHWSSGTTSTRTPPPASQLTKPRSCRSSRNRTSRPTWRIPRPKSCLEPRPVSAVGLPPSAPVASRTAQRTGTFSIGGHGPRAGLRLNFLDERVLVGVSPGERRTVRHFHRRSKRISILGPGRIRSRPRPGQSAAS